MEFGFSLPSRGQAATMQNMRLLAQHVEALGLDSVWVSDHIIVPRHIDSFYPYDSEGRFPSAPDQDYYEPLTTLAFLLHISDLSGCCLGCSQNWPCRQVRTAYHLREGF